MMGSSLPLRSERPSLAKAALPKPLVLSIALAYLISHVTLGTENVPY